MLYITEVKVPKVKKGKLFVEQELPMEGALPPSEDSLSHEEHCKRALNQALQANLNQVAKLNDVNGVSTEEETRINVSIVAMSPNKWKQFYATIEKLVPSSKKAELLKQFNNF